MPQKVVLPVIGVSTASFLARLGGADVVFPLTLLVDLLFVSPQVFRGGKSLRASRTNLALCVILEMIAIQTLASGIFRWRPDRLGIEVKKE